MELEELSKELKELVAAYDTGWFLGDLANLMRAAGKNQAEDQLGNLSSPLRQLYYLGGLLVTSDPANGTENTYNRKKWNKIVKLLNHIEHVYTSMFFPADEENDDDWKKIREVAMPSFLDYFNQGPLNFEEQIVNWIKDLYQPLDVIISEKNGLSTTDFLKFYENLDALHQKNFRGFFPKGTPRDNWRDYAKVQLINSAPEPLLEMLKESLEETEMFMYFTADHGIIDRFYVHEIVSEELPLQTVQTILDLLTVERAEREFLYYTAMKPGNPLYTHPIVYLGEGMYQVFEIKQVIHAIESLLEKICTKNKVEREKFVTRKGDLLEARIEELFKLLLKRDFQIFKGYYVDGCEQDLLILWKNFAFIVEAKGFNLREPLRDPHRAYVRIKDDFDACIGYGYEQCKRVERKFVSGETLEICDKSGRIMKTINTGIYEDNAFSIIVNLKTFGQVQTNLSPLLEIEDGLSYPWAVRLDDLETFILTLVAQKKGAKEFVDFLLMRERLHEKLICNDELQLCGGFLSRELNQALIDKEDVIITSPELAKIFDLQYRKGLGFRDEKYIKEKRSGTWMFV